MARYLLAASPLLGHVLPMLRIGADLRRRGHDVCLLTGAEFAERITKAGLHPATLPPQARVYRRSSPPGLTHVRLPAMLRRYLSGRAELQSVFIAPLIGQYCALQALLRRQRTDAVLVDIAFTGALPLLLTDGPRPPVLVCGVGPLTLSSCDTPPFGAALRPDPSVNYTDLTRLVHRTLFANTTKRLNQALKAVNVGPSPVFLSDWPRLADRLLQLTVPSFEYARRDLPSTVNFTGPVVPDSPDGFDPPTWWDQLTTTRRTVLVTQGTWDNVDLDQLIGPTLRALADRRDLLVIATTGGAPLPPPNGHFPANAHVTDYLPYPLLLPHVDVMITNGGYGGVQHALRHGVPVIVAGETADKAEVAARVEYTGAGIDLGTARPTPAVISTAVNRILTTDNHRIAAQRIGHDLAVSTALDNIADILANLPDQPITPKSAQNTASAGE